MKESTISRGLTIGESPGPDLPAARGLCTNTLRTPIGKIDKLNDSQFENKCSKSSNVRQRAREANV